MQAKPEFTRRLDQILPEEGWRVGVIAWVEQWIGGWTHSFFTRGSVLEDLLIRLRVLMRFGFDREIGASFVGLQLLSTRFTGTLGI